MGKKRKVDSYKAGLTRNAFKKNRRWEVDNLDPQSGYVEELKKQAKSEDPKKSEEAREALAFLSKFNAEYYDSHGLDKEDALHNDSVIEGEYKVDKWGNYKLDENGERIPKTLRDSCYERTNSANRDAYGIQDSGGALFNTDEADMRNSSSNFNSNGIPDTTMDRIQQPHNPQSVVDAIDELVDRQSEIETKLKKHNK